MKFEQRLQRLNGANVRSQSQARPAHAQVTRVELDCSEDDIRSAQASPDMSFEEKDFRVAAVEAHRWKMAEEHGGQIVRQSVHGTCFKLVSAYNCKSEVSR